MKRRVVPYSPSVVELDEGEGGLARGTLEVDGADLAELVEDVLDVALLHVRGQVAHVDLSPLGTRHGADANRTICNPTSINSLLQTQLNCNSQPKILLFPKRRFFIIT